MSESFGKVLGLVGTVAIASAGLILIARGPLPASQTVMAQAFNAKDTYLDKCAVCHGQDGHGKTAKGRKDKVKDIDETIKTESEDQMIKIATDGKAPNMDAYGKTFTPQQIKALVEYYRSLANQK